MWYAMLFSPSKGEIHDNDIGQLGSYLAQNILVPSCEDRSLNGV